MSEQSMGETGGDATMHAADVFNYTRKNTIEKHATLQEITAYYDGVGAVGELNLTVWVQALGAALGPRHYR